MEQTDKKKSRDFNIYYLNFSKVYEIAMMINNVILTKIETDHSSSFEAQYGFTSSISAQGTKDFLDGIKASISADAKETSTSSSKVVESLDVKTTKSSIIGHVSSATTLDIYSHVTDTMQKQAAVKIDHQIGKTDAPMPQEEQKKSCPDQRSFQPYQPKHRKPGTGCVYQINDHLWEGKYSPRGADGKRISRNVYARTKEECEEKLAVMIEEVKKEIEAAKSALKMSNLE